MGKTALDPLLSYSKVLFYLSIDHGKKIVLNGLTKRVDLLITEKTEPVVLIECKAPQIKLTEKTFEQTARYNSIIGAKEIILTNGLQHINAYYQDGQYQFYRPE